MLVDLLITSYVCHINILWVCRERSQTWHIHCTALNLPSLIFALLRSESFFFNSLNLPTFQFLCLLQSIAAHRDNFVRRLSVRLSACLSGSLTFLVVYVWQATHAFLGMLPLFYLIKSFYIIISGNASEFFLMLEENITWVEIFTAYSVLNNVVVSQLHFILIDIYFSLCGQVRPARKSHQCDDRGSERYCTDMIHCY